MASTVLKWLGFNRASLPQNARTAVERYVQNGAVNKVGPIEKVEILQRDGKDPVHQSHFNPADKEDVLSLRIWPVKGQPATHHCYMDGTGTRKKGDNREYSTFTRSNS